MKMLMLFFALTTSVAKADVNLGKRIDFFSDSDKPAFGVQMSSSITAITFSIHSDDVTQKKSVTQIQIRFVDKITGEFLSDLITIGNYNGGALLPRVQSFTTSVTGMDALKVQSMLKTSALLLGVKDGINTIFSGYVDLGQYCSTSKSQFINVDTGVSGCPNQGNYKVAQLSSCLSKVVVDGSWVGKISSEIQCLTKNPNFNNAMAFLCSKDQSTLSVQYKKYADLKDKVKAAFGAFKNAQDPGSRMQASQDLEDAKKQLSIFGYENEVLQALSGAGSAHEFCHVN